MKIKSRLILALLSASSLAAAPLTKTVAVHAKPDAASPTIAVLNAGTEPVPHIGTAEPLSSGWSAIELAGPHTVYVAKGGIAKSLDVKPGSPLYTQPKIDAPVLTVMELGDSAAISGFHGKWTQVKLDKKVVGYINSADVAPTTGAPVASAKPTTPAAQPPPAPAPAAPAAYTGPGRAVQRVDLGDGGASALPRLFQGKFVSSRRPLMPRRPYDFQLNDNGGDRYAYLDLSKLLQTEQIDKYVDHTVVVYGTAKPVQGTKDIVILVESLQLK